MQTRRHQSRRVRDVGEEERADLVGDCAKARIVQLAAVGAGPGDDRPRPHFLARLATSS